VAALSGQHLTESLVATRKKSINFEDSLSQLEELVNALEAGDLSLEESLKAFEKGIRITRECNEALKEATQRVELLTRNDQGDIEATPFDTPEDN
jgi:exodeoxyribonuclease VII small subunit